MRLAPLLPLSLWSLAACTGARIPASPPLRHEMLVSPAQLATMRQQAGVVVLQVERDSATFRRAHVPGSRFLTLAAIVTTREGVPNELPPAATLDSVFRRAGVTSADHVVVTGEPIVAARAFFTLDQLGYPKLSMLDGGLAAWRGAGNPVDSGSPLPPLPLAASAAAPRPRPGVVVDAVYVLNHIEHPGVALVDARPEAEYSGAVSGDGVPRPGHIPSAGTLFWKTLITSDSMPTLRDSTTLRARFAAAGVSPGDTIVTYCRTGVQASFAYFVARYLGYPVRMYDGSFIEWSAGRGYPVAR